MSRNLTFKLNLDLSPADKFKSRLVTSDVERSFYLYNSVLGDNRKLWIFQHLKEMFVTHCYGNRQ